MHATLLGTGAPPPNPLRRGPATLLALGTQRFLVDAGSGVGAQLVQAGVRPTTTPRAMPGAAASITFQNDSFSRRIRGMAKKMAPKNPPRREMPPSQTRRMSSGASM